LVLSKTDEAMKQLTEANKGEVIANKKHGALQMTCNMTVTLKAVLDVAKQGGGYSVDDSNCHHMCLDVYNFILQEHKKEPLPQSVMPNYGQVKMFKALTKAAKKMPGVKGKIGFGKSTVQSEAQFGQSTVEGCGVKMSKELSPTYVASAASAACPVAAVSAAVQVAAPGVLSALGALGEAAGVAIEMSGMALPQANPCIVCEEGTATKFCQNCQQELCGKCAKTRKHRKHAVGDITKNPLHN
jgi:hypothetical protein